MSNESKKEIHDYLDSPLSVVGSDSKLIYGLSSGAILKFTLFAASYHSLEG